MREVTVTYQVYQFDELGEKARAKAIDDTIQFILVSDCQEFTVVEAQKKAESMLTPWFTGGYIWEYAHDFVVDMCRNYEYLNDGEIYQGIKL